ncbi:MAG: hypothetical protein KHX75_11550 [Lachnospiraceae bacterium]|nr:hypothetical protein [Lachnospiraceae bacterium]
MINNSPNNTMFNFRKDNRVKFFLFILFILITGILLIHFNARKPKYTPTYVKADNSLINISNQTLEGLFIDNYSIQMDPVAFETVFDRDKIRLSFGPYFPSGYDFKAYLNNYARNLEIQIPDQIYNNVINSFISEFNDIAEGSSIQISPYDFDNDNIAELIICIVDPIPTIGICAVFSYTHVDNYKKVNPFVQELCIPIQKGIILNGNTLSVPYGSKNIIDKEYMYIDGRFMEETL